MAQFLEHDPKGAKLLDFLSLLGESLKEEQAETNQNLNRMLEKVQTIHDVVQTQQSYAKADFFLERLDLRHVVENVLTLQANALERDAVSVARSFQKTAPVKVQKTKLVQVLLNLCSNAIDAMAHLERGSRTLHISLSQQGERVFLNISDNGCGIPQDLMCSIFNHGFTTKKNSFGFGLHSCANFMAEMNGEILVESEGLNQGATFILSFPEAKPKSPRAIATLQPNGQ